MRAFTIFAASLLFVLPAWAQYPPPTVWHNDLELAKRQAQQTGRLVLVHFWAPWCGPCKELETAVFGQPGFEQALASLCVPVKLNVDANPAIVAQYRVTQIPADILIKPDGTLVEQMSSPPTLVEYLTRVKQVAMQHQPPGAPPIAAAAVPATMAAYSGQAQPGNAQGMPPQGYAPQANDPHGFAPQGHPQGHDPYAGYQQPGYGQQTPDAAGYAQQPPYAQQQPYGQSHDPYAGAAAEQQYGQPAQQPQAMQPGSYDPAGYAAQAPPYSPAQTGQADPYAAGAGMQQQYQGAPTGGENPYAPGMAAQPPAAAPFHAAEAPQAQPAPFGLDGYCPVTLCESHQWTQGNPEWGVQYRGRTYLFATAEAKQKFWENPDRYAPVASGLDPVMAVDGRQDVPGQRAHGVFFEDRIYLFANEQSLETFKQNPDRYSAEILQARR